MKKLCSAILILVLVVALTVPAFAADSAAVKAALDDTAKYVFETVKNPIVDSIGGEWAILGLARSGYDVPDEYYAKYYATVEKTLTDTDGVLHAQKYTEYSRVIIALTAAGYDPRDVAGYDLTLALGDFEKTIWQGINGPIFALIALDSGNYEIPANPAAKTQATRALYVAEILRRQLDSGGFSLSGGTSNANRNDSPDADVTAMAVQALAKYRSTPGVEEAIEKALNCLSDIQLADGGFSSWGEANLESVVQVVVALAELGEPLDDARFVKNGKTIVDTLLSFHKKGSGFVHTAGGSGSAQMSTEQGLYALAAIDRAEGGKTALYDMSDVARRAAAAPEDDTVSGLPGKHADVAVQTVTSPGKTFDDIKNHANKPAIEALAERGIINGKGDGFDPDATMTRAEFAAIVTRGLGLEPKAVRVFSDVNADDWFDGVVGAAYTYEIVNGTSETTFAPQGTLTRAEAAVMIARAAKLCGIDTELSDVETRDMLAQFGDYTSLPSWARNAVAFCVRDNILTIDTFDINHGEAVCRAEISEMLFRMLTAAKLV